MKKYFLSIVLLSSVILVMSGCSLFSEGAGDSGKSGGGGEKQSAYETMLKQVTEEYKEVDKMGAAWAYTDETLEKAAEAAKINDFDKAMKLLKSAEEETQLARAQFEQQKKATSTLF